MDNQTQFKIWYRPEICDKFDFRIKYIWNLETELKKVPWNNNTFDWETWSVFKVSEQFIFDKKKFSITQPEMTAIYLNFSNKSFQESIKNLKNLEKDMTWFFDFEEKWFDLLENIIASIIFSVSALEVFFNQHLINSNETDELITVTNENWEIKGYNKKALEWLSIEEKFLWALPIIYKIDRTLIKKIESNFKQLIKIRNRLVHLKSIDLKNNVDIKKQTTLRKQLFEQTKNNPAILSKNIIKFFYDEWKIEYPRWLRLLPF